MSAQGIRYQLFQKYKTYWLCVFESYKHLRIFQDTRGVQISWGWCLTYQPRVVFWKWRRYCLFNPTITQHGFSSDRNIMKNKNEISRFVSWEGIEQFGFFFIYLNRNLPQSCTFVSTGWTNVCNIAIQDTPRDLPSIHKCSNLSGYPTLTSLASRMVWNTISQILMRWSDYGQMDQCCTVWGEWGLNMSIYSPRGRGYLG